VPGTEFSPYSYTTFGSWTGTLGQTADGRISRAEGFLAYGIPTAAAGIPISGSATYSATVQGGTPTGFFIGGAATLQFQFAAGILSGHFDPIIYDWDFPANLGRYDFSNTVFAAGSPNFSGTLSQAGVTGTGSFNGQFTGPQAEELMAGFVAPLNNPFVGPMGGVPDTMFGVWVGKKN
jgi:hypothetical protein